MWELSSGKLMSVYNKLFLLYAAFNKFFSVIEFYTFDKTLKMIKK